MKVKKSTEEKVIEFFLEEHEGSEDKGLFHIDYGFKFSFLEIPEVKKKETNDNIKRKI